MNLRMLILVLTLGNSLASSLFAGAERGHFLVGEVGGVPGAAGHAGAAGTAGLAGVAGTSAILDYSDFYITDTDLAYSGPVTGLETTGLAAGSAMPFPHAGNNSGVITSNGAGTQFTLPAVGTYLVQFAVTTANAGQLQLNLNGAYVANSVVGRATGETQIVGVSLVTTTTVGSVLEVVNPPANTVITFPPFGAIGAAHFTDHISIMRIQ